MQGRQENNNLFEALLSAYGPFK
ncbi:hypothetical protein XACS582_14500004 [Xanthomonas citri pv. citri]|nr:hypothetical protein XAC902_1960005 [Xanthomonas citri pv. citri]CEE30792.1 hypothetical protein XAC2911_1710003 [Xanthomonas citri pv. citri]CEE56385.1 hypothetical protein XACS584_1500003 [Xanthomonas citri pv. citri]CEF22240.1 hypothetical protein XACJK2_1660002 [Xanthomonas citri pv. citri]CEH59157.1 hypothetical protein XACJK48_9040004 [Xanthomonas citri pv. citri]